MVPVLAVLIVVAGIGGFFGGVQYQKGKQPAVPSFARNGDFATLRNVNGRVRGNFGGGGAVRGTVMSVQGSTLTVQDASGSSKIVILGSSTTVENTVTASVGDVTVGKTIMASGTSNSDGSVTATNIQLNPSTIIGIGGQQPPTVPIN